MMWSRRQAWVTGSPIAFTCSSWSTSSAIEKALRPRFLPSFSTGSRCSSLRLQIATSAPARANSMAIDFPIPVPPPVTMAVLPSKENGDVVMAATILQPRGPVYGLGLRPRLGDLGLTLGHLGVDLLPD